MEETETEPTITIVLGYNAKSVRKPIEFRLFLDIDETFERADLVEDCPKDWKYIELICKEYRGIESLDLMYAYDNPKDRAMGRFFIGQWNDGYVER